MITVKIGSVTMKLNKNEAKEVELLNGELLYNKNNGERYLHVVQRHADTWVNSAITEVAKNRRKEAVKALGLSA